MVTVVCPICKTKFDTFPSRLKQGRRYCSGKCGKRGMALAQSKLPIDGKLTCSVCKIAKPVDEFYKSAKTPSGRCSQCKSCMNAQSQRYRDDGRARDMKRLRKFGMDAEQFDAMLKKQKGRCAICTGKLVLGRKLHVDHCHETGVVRGLLCDGCNLGLGFFRDEPVYLRAAIEYLNKERV